ncbi:glycosyltransferase family 2 protein [Gracilibacillus alcaliphilus]|uniref:glycosyltransferase family 2 protein n=1 Tax=Gracilibacillus alcaliphilus TaxID=1401441 RepID=UPI00195B6710|nr:glycosyltransferase [Gracilibacillus alcaliphilus]
MKEPLITVVIPVYNVREYLSECIESVLNQCYKNIEIICVDDGSNDGSSEILKQYDIQHFNIKVITQKNQGQSAARNQGIELAQGKYIYFLDSDDLILSDTFSSLVPQMEKYHLDIIRFGAKSFSSGKNVAITHSTYDFSDEFNTKKIYNKEDFLRKSKNAFSASPVLYIIRKDILAENNILFEPNIIHEDELFTTKVFISVNRAMYASKFYYHRRYREGSTMTSKAQSKFSFDSKVTVLYRLIELKTSITDLNEIMIIEDRINNLINSLYTYSKIDSRYKKSCIKNFLVKNTTTMYYFKAFRLFIKRKIYGLKNRLKHLYR